MSYEWGIPNGGKKDWRKSSGNIWIDSKMKQGVSH